jgi:hypothetical protein
MNNNNITNTKNITYTGYNDLMNSFVSSSSMFNFDSVLLGDNTNGSGFNFKCIKSSSTKNLSIDYNNVNLNNRTLTNCSTIDTLNNYINTNISDITELVTRRPGFAKCRVVRDTSTYTLAWSFGFVPVSTPPYNVYAESVSAGVVQLIVFSDVTARRGLVNDQFIVNVTGLDGTNPYANRVMYGLCFSKTYISYGLLPGYRIKILLTRGDDIAGSRDLSIGVSSFLDIIVTW